ncbi:hypothetical protein P2318_16025 [Myxococcaceae bacterium GXIMD 01537]
MRRAVWVLALVLPWAALAEDKAPKAGVSWETQVLRATGAGAPDLKASNPAQARLGAERAAKLDAFRNLLEQARGVHISAGRTVGDALAGDEVRTRVEGVIRDFKVSGRRYFSDSGVELDVEVPLAAIAAVVVPAADAPLALNTQGAKKYTGLVVDAGGLGVSPVLAPRLVDGTGRVLYGAEALSSEARATVGVAAWFTQVDAARQAARVGATPLVLKAAKVQGSDLVLSDEAVKQLAEIHTGFLAEGRVAIVAR